MLRRGCSSGMLLALLAAVCRADNLKTSSWLDPMPTPAGTVVAPQVQFVPGSDSALLMVTQAGALVRVDTSKQQWTMQGMTKSGLNDDPSGAFKLNLKGDSSHGQLPLAGERCVSVTGDGRLHCDPTAW